MAKATDEKARTTVFVCAKCNSYSREAAVTQGGRTDYIPLTALQLVTKEEQLSSWLRHLTGLPTVFEQSRCPDCANAADYEEHLAKGGC